MENCIKYPVEGINSHGLGINSPELTQQDIRSLFFQKNDCGLLPLVGQNKDVEIQIRESISGNVEVNLFNCNTVTASGEWIDFNLTGNETPFPRTFSPEEYGISQTKIAYCLGISLHQLKKLNL